MRLFFLISLSIALFSSTALAKLEGSFGVRGGIGTDVGLGLAYGAGVNYLIPTSSGAFEPGIVIFGGRFQESTVSESNNRYTETTDVFVFGLLANFLVGYETNNRGSFFIGGIGLASVATEWTETSPDDSSIGGTPPLYSTSAEGGTAGSVFNIGYGFHFGKGLDLRFEIPVILAFSQPGKASAVIPTAIATVGYRF